MTLNSVNMLYLQLFIITVVQVVSFQSWKRASERARKATFNWLNVLWLLISDGLGWETGLEFLLPSAWPRPSDFCNQQGIFTQGNVYFAFQFGLFSVNSWENLRRSGVSEKRKTVHLSPTAMLPSKSLKSPFFFWHVIGCLDICIQKQLNRLVDSGSVLCYCILFFPVIALV